MRRIDVVASLYGATLHSLRHRYSLIYFVTHSSISCTTSPGTLDASVDLSPVICHSTPTLQMFIRRGGVERYYYNNSGDAVRPLHIITAKHTRTV